MAYSKQTWVRGEKVASTKLNHMEDGIATISANGAIDTVNLAPAAVTNDKLDQEAVDSNNIRTGAIITPLIYDGAVTRAKIADAALADIAAEYSSSKTYAVGDYVFHSGALYRCVSAITTAEAWTAAHWTRVTLGDDVADLKSALDDFEDNTFDISYSKNLFNPDDPDVQENKYLNINGTIESYSGRSISGYMPVEVGKYLTFSYTSSGSRAAYSMPSICFYDEGKSVVSGGNTYKNKIIVPNGAKYAKVCYGRTVSKLQAEITADGIFTTPYEAYHEPVYKINSNVVIPQSQISGLVEALAAVSDVANDVEELQDQMADIAVTQEYNEPYFSQYLTPYNTGYMATNGTVTSDSSYVYTDKIPVRPGYVVRGITTDHTENCNLRFVCAFNGDTAVSAKGNSSDLATYTIPDGIDYVVVTQRASVAAGKTRSVEISGSYEAISTKLKQNPMGFMRTTGDISDGEELHVSENNVKNNVCVAFSGNITTFNKLYIGQRKGTAWKDCYLEIDSMNVVLHTDQGSSTSAHGLTIGSDIQILIETQNEIETSLIRIVSDGNVYNDTAAHRWLCDEGYAAVVSSGSVLTDCALSWTSRSINSPIWIFGDSYVSLYNARWAYHLLHDGFDNVMINGFAGEQSNDAMTSLQNLLATHRPQYIFWILGMNNGDGESTVNTSWKKNYDLLIDLCKKWNITPVLGTIPNVPTVNNTYKNAIIRASGYRYVDFAKAVDPDEDGTWISGTLSNDGVHPTAKGAIVLYQRALADFPELMSY